MLIAYEPNSDVLTITLHAAPVAQSQVQGTVTVGFDAAGTPVSIAIPNASTLLWENGGQVQVMTAAAPAPAAQTVAQTRVETTRVTRVE